MYFEEVVLKTEPKDKLVGTVLDALCYRHFTAASDRNAHDLGLFDKTNKDAPLGHLDDLFGRNFQLQFGDSEQVIRLYIGKRGGSDMFDMSPIDLGDLQEFEDGCRNYKQLYDFSKKFKDKKNSLIHSIVALEEDLKPRIYDWLRNNVRFDLEIVSAYDMCKNCKATFDYDNRIKHQVSLNFLRMFANGLGDIYPNLSWCLKGWSYGGGELETPYGGPLLDLRVWSHQEY